MEFNCHRYQIVSKQCHIQNVLVLQVARHSLQITSIGK